MLIKDLYKTGRPVVSLEVFPPKKDANIDVLYAALERMAGFSPDFISVTYGAGGSGNVNKTAEIASFIQSKLGIPALAHLTCVGCDKEKITSTLDEMHRLGIQNTLALRGDLPEGENEAGSFRFAGELIGHIKSRGDFCIGAACYPEGHIECENLDDDLRHLRLKQDAGADFLITQLFFDNDIFSAFLERARKAGITVPISAGVMPILGRSQIERMIFLCGSSLPSPIIRLLHKYGKNPEDLREAGMEHAARQMEDLLKRGAQGVHIYTMNKPEISERCMKRIGRA